MSPATFLALLGALLAAGLAGLALIERRAARSRRHHRGELSLHRQQLRVTLRRSDAQVARVEAVAAAACAEGYALDEDAPDACGCARCAHLAVALELRERTAPWIVPVVVSAHAPRRVGFVVRWGHS